MSPILCQPQCADKKSLQVQVMAWFLPGREPGGRLDKKDGLTGYGDSHVKDKTSYRPSYL